MRKLAEVIEPHVTRHREPADILAWFVVLACIGLAVSPLIAGIVTMLGGER